MLWRQGDVLIESVAEVPAKAMPRTGRVLYEGEATGHKHRVEEEADTELFLLGDSLYLRVKSPQATIVHDEHGPITLTAGVYRLWQQREYRGENNFSPIQD